MTSKTRSALTTEQTTNFADNTTGAITPSILRTTVQDMIDSTGTLLDSNTWSGTAMSFTGSVAFSGAISFSGITAIGSTGSLFVSSAAGLFGGTTSTSTLIVQSTNVTPSGGDQIFLGASNFLFKGLTSAPANFTLGQSGSAYGQLAIAGSTSGNTTILATAAASGTQTLQAATDTFVYLATTDTLNNKTIGSALSFAGSTSGTTKLQATGAASGTLSLPPATDQLVGRATLDTLTNKTLDSAGTGNSLQVSSIALSRGQYPGSNTNDTATAGNFGEIVTSQVLQGAAVSLTTGSTANITSIALTAGDWNVWGNVAILPSSALSFIEGWVSSTTAAVPTFPNFGGIILIQTAFANATQNIVPVGQKQFNLSVSTTIFLSTQCTFGASAAAYGFIGARRMR